MNHILEFQLYTLRWFLESYQKYFKIESIRQSVWPQIPENHKEKASSSGIFVNLWQKSDRLMDRTENPTRNTFNICPGILILVLLIDCVISSERRVSIFKVRGSIPIDPRATINLKPRPIIR